MSSTARPEGVGHPFEPGSAADWLRRARSDLALASAPRPDGVLLEDLAFHGQQAAEKAIRAQHRADAGFSGQTIQNVSENAKVLRFSDFGFDKE